VKRVAVVQELLAQYRVPFYHLLHENLTAEGIELSLIHGQAAAQRASHDDEATVPWAIGVANRSLMALPGKPVVWQPAWRHIQGSDLVIVEQANRQLINYPLLLNQALGKRPFVALWGHGANLQAPDANSVAERLKRRISTQAHWWFAYTAGSADRVAALGFPRDRITVVQNAVDTSEYRSDTAAGKRPMECVFLGSLHEHKRVAFLLAVGARLAEVLPNFRLSVVGTGVGHDLVERAALSSEWLTYHGPLFGPEKVQVVSRASLMLMPGLVGLAIVEAFAAGTPIVTTDYPFHSPEIEYLEDGVNGVMLPRGISTNSYAEAVADLLVNTDRIRTLSDGARTSADRYTLTAMAERYAAGVVAAVRNRPSSEER
jgi:glycosyltransferase involved in cell wall biosynthesis